jgi:eukaryotic-like serine/threonine-protein kinase
MSPPSESSLLRLAIAKGLLRWEDLDAVADHLSGPASDGAGSRYGGRWLAALLAAGYLDLQMIDRLAAELEQSRDDRTPDLTGGARPWPEASQEPLPRTARDADFPPELRFLADWARYHVDHLLGTGGMGTVFKAFDPTLGRWVALKFLHRNDAAQTRRFLREARAQARVSHPNVCQVHEVGEVEGRPYIAMQYIEGRSLGELTEELPLETKVRLVRDVARAVHAAHRTSLIHRDLKPGNILLAREESGALHPYVVDFGLALDQDETGLSRTGMISGTPAYISPEQAQGKALDRRTDVYSLGVVLYEQLAGTPPFAGGNVARVLVDLVQQDPKPLRQAAPGTPEDLETIIAKCLEKDPARRYDSARDLAEDLDRFLEGEPIHARPAGWRYRTAKRLRKNRALALVSAAAILALIVLGLLSLRAQWRARERTELAQRFGQRIGTLEASIAFEASLPPHDITPHKRRLREEMDAIRAEMRKLGSIADGPGHYALGKGYLALHQYESARDHLQRAWQAGERGPDVAEALGIALGLSYERAVAEADGSLSPSEGQARREEAERTYGRPALDYLREARASSPGSPYLAGLIALYERRYDDALEAARRAGPDEVSSSRLQAKVWRFQASEAAQAGQYSAAQQLFEKAGDAYGRLASRMPSNPDLYAAECECRTRRIIAAMAREDVPRDQAIGSLAACDEALRIDPGLTDATVLKADLFRRLGDQQRKRGEDPTPVLTTAVRLAERAVASEPRNALAYHALASAHQVLAQWRLGRGLDAGAELRQGIEAAQKSVDAQPELASTHVGLGAAYLVLVLEQQRRGADPRQALERAAASFQRASELNPRSTPALTGLGNTWKAMAEVQMAQGVDPGGSTAKAAAALERAAALNPASAVIRNNLGNVHLTQGSYLLMRGLDPRVPLTDAVRNYQRSLQLKPDYSLAAFNLGYTYRSLAEALVEQGQDPKPALDASRAALDEAHRLNPADADVFLETARVDLLAARWKQQHHQDSGPDLRAASVELDRAEELNPEQPDVFFTQALIASRHAEGTRDNGSRAAALREGLARIGKALAINSGEARYLALRGQLELQSARAEAATDRRRERAKQAVASLENALRINPLLQREYGPVLLEARVAAGLARPRPVQL